MVTSSLIVIGLLWAIVKVGGLLIKVVKGEGKRRESKKGNDEKDKSDRFGGGSGGGGGSSRGF